MRFCKYKHLFPIDDYSVSCCVAYFDIISPADTLVGEILCGTQTYHHKLMPVTVHLIYQSLEPADILVGLIVPVDVVSVLHNETVLVKRDAITAFRHGLFRRYVIVSRADSTGNRQDLQDQENQGTRDTLPLPRLPALTWPVPLPSTHLSPLVPRLLSPKISREQTSRALPPRRSWRNADSTHMDFREEISTNPKPSGLLPLWYNLRTCPLPDHQSSCYD